MFSETSGKCFKTFVQHFSRSVCLNLMHDKNEIAIINTRVPTVSSIYFKTAKNESDAVSGYVILTKIFNPK